jgi:Lrp/AsnC family transcriptional regulator
MTNEIGTILDKTDLLILDILQKDSTVSINEIADRVNLSQTPCWRRIQRLEASGHIMGKVALLNPNLLNLNVTVFVFIKTNKHNREWYEKFSAVVQAIPEIVDFYRMNGTVDYLLKIVVPDIATYDAVYQRLTRTIEIFDVTSSFAMEKMKSTTVLPLNYAQLGRDSDESDAGSTN